jgi:hypothetical protein
MKHWIACFLIVAGLSGSGCDSINRSQIQVLPGRSRAGTAVATVPATEREAVKQVLQQIALKHKFEDRTALSLHPDVLCDYYQPVTVQPPSKNPMRLTAWVSGDRIAIDLSQKSVEGGESIAYQNLRKQIIDDLKERFGDRVAQVPKTRQVTARVQHAQ